MALKTTEEKIQELLARLDIPVEETTSIEAFQAALERELGYAPSEYMMAKAWEGTGYRYETLAQSGIRPVIVIYPWGREVRYGVKGHPGLWGFEGMQQFIGQELEGGE